MIHFANVTDLSHICNLSIREKSGHILNPVALPAKKDTLVTI